MIKNKKQVVGLSLRIVDVVSLLIAFLLTVVIVSYPEAGISFTDFLSMRIKVSNLLIFTGFISICLVILAKCGLYQSRTLSMSQEIFNILFATMLVTVMLMLISEMAKISLVNNIFFIVFWLVFSAIMILSRSVARNIAKALRLRGLNLVSVLIIGTNDRAMNLAQKLESKPELGYRIQGFVDNLWSMSDKFSNCGRQVIATLDELPSFLRLNPIDEAIVCLPLGAYYHEVAKIVSLCENQGISVSVPTDFFNLGLAQSNVEHFENQAMITMMSGSIYGWPQMVKRGIDIILSALLLVLLLPVFVITGVIIKTTSPGPLFFVQDRVGLNKRIFKMYKFRTMVVDAEKKQADLEKLNEVSGPVFKIKNDPRIIPVGKILRKLSIDELPQLLNVLKGDMSLVGPRPLPVRDYQGFKEDWHRRRFSVRPGITCLWQIKGRSNTSFDRWMELDLQYIDHWSLWLDAKILFGTIPVVMKGSGAS